MNGKHARRTTQYPRGSVGFGDSPRRPRSAALSNLRSQIAGPAQPLAAPPMAPNKANRRCFRAENAVSTAERTQSARPVPAALSNLRSEIAGAQECPGLVSSCVQNKPNFLRFWAENAGWAKKQTQSKPISTATGPVRDKARPAGRGLGRQDESAAS